MAKGPRGFTDQNKYELKMKLCLECESSWAIHGYKKTSIGDLTKKIGISTGAFYLLYSSKEELFCDTIEGVKTRLKNELTKIVTNESGKSGFIKAMIWHFEEYDRFPFLYNSTTPDFLALLNKLPKDRIENLKFDSISFFYNIIDISGLTLKVDKEKAYAVISTLLHTVTINEFTSYNRFEIFEFLLNGLIDEVFE